MTEIFNSLASTAVGAWSLSGVILYVAKLKGRRGPRVCRVILAEVKPFYWPAIIVWLFTEALLRGIDGWTIYMVCNWALAWYWYRNLDDDDDRWKRRKKKLAERVSIVGSRLTVVPATGGA